MIKGIYISSYVMCKTELWYQSRNINLDKFDQNMLEGRLIHEISLYNLASSKRIGPIAVDRINFSKKEIYEIKKSNKSLEEGKYQLLYYIYYIKKLTGNLFEGILDIPKEKIKLRLKLKEDDEKIINEITEGIKKVINLKEPPTPTKKPYCKGCMYYELCWS